MNRILNLILLLVIALVSSTPITAQVTIGSTQRPMKGALLDLKDNGTYDNSKQTASKGLGLPRVKLTNLTPKTDIELAQSIGDTSNEFNLNDHIGLLVYNAIPDLCAVEPIYKGVHIWNGEKWEFMGENFYPGVNTYVDSRDNNVYRYREFHYTDNGIKVSAGSWMLENLRYIPTESDFNHSTEFPSSTTPIKSWCYPLGANMAYDHSQAEINWDTRSGIFYNWYGATNGENDSRDDQMVESTVGPTIPLQGICPSGWHLPSDVEWNELERAIYNNPTTYSQYTGQAADGFSPASWLPAWDAETYSSRGSTPTGHGLAMLSECALPNNPYGNTTGGKSLPSVQGGFEILLAGNLSGSMQRNVGYYGIFWNSSSSGFTAGSHRQFTYGKSQVYRSFADRYIFMPIRCKKNN